MSCECTMFSHVYRKMLWKESCFIKSNKRYRLSRSLLVNDFNRKAIRQKIYYLYQANLIVLMTNSSIYSHIYIPSLLKSFFQNFGGFIASYLGGFIAALKIIPGYYFNNNNCYNRTSLYIIRTIILNCHVTDG